MELLVKEHERYVFNRSQVTKSINHVQRYGRGFSMPRSFFERREHAQKLTSQRKIASEPQTGTGGDMGTLWMEEIIGKMKLRFRHFNNVDRYRSRLSLMLTFTRIFLEYWVTPAHLPLYRPFIGSSDFTHFSLTFLRNQLNSGIELLLIGSSQTNIFYMCIVLSKSHIMFNQNKDWP